MQRALQRRLGPKKGEEERRRSTWSTIRSPVFNLLSNETDFLRQCKQGVLLRWPFVGSRGRWRGRWCAGDLRGQCFFHSLIAHSLDPHIPHIPQRRFDVSVLVIRFVVLKRTVPQTLCTKRIRDGYARRYSLNRDLMVVLSGWFKRRVRRSAESI